MGRAGAWPVDKSEGLGGWAGRACRQGAHVLRLMHKQVHPGGAMGSQRPRGRQPKGALYVIETVLDLPKVDPKIGQKLARDGSEVPPDTPKLIRGRIVGSGKPR